MAMLSADDARGIDAVRASLVSAILAGDADAYARCFTADGILMHPDTPFVRGTAALHAYGAGVFAAVRVSRLRLTPIIVDGTGATAFEVGVQELAVEPSSDKFKSKRQHLHVYEKQTDGQWKIAAAVCLLLIVILHAA